MGYTRERLGTPDTLRLHRDLLPHAKRWINDAFTTAQQHSIESGLQSVVRMGGLREKGFLNPPGFKQTNLEHTGNILADAKELSGVNALSQHIDFSQVQIYGYGHDVPEVLDKVGDVYPTGRTKRDEARKRLEHMAAKYFLIPQIINPEMREDALKKYKEYETASPNNLEVQFTKYLDQRDGTVRYAGVAFNRHEATPLIVNAMRLHLFETMPRLITPAINLLVGLPTHEARSAMRELLLDDLSYLEKYVPKEVVNSYKERFAS